jgi:hypothetical protein
MIRVTEADNGSPLPTVRTYNAKDWGMSEGWLIVTNGAVDVAQFPPGSWFCVEQSEYRK